MNVDDSQQEISVDTHTGLENTHQTQKLQQKKHTGVLFGVVITEIVRGENGPAFTPYGLGLRASLGEPASLEDGSRGRAYTA